MKDDDLTDGVLKRLHSPHRAATFPHHLNRLWNPYILTLVLGLRAMISVNAFKTGQGRKLDGCDGIRTHDKKIAGKTNRSRRREWVLTMVVFRKGCIFRTVWALSHTTSIDYRAVTCLTLVLGPRAIISVNFLGRGTFHGTTLIQKQLDAGMTTEFGYT